MARRSRKQPKQLELVGIADAPVRRLGRGGKRMGAGRKRAPGKRESVPHRPRPVHFWRHPVHVTLRAIKGLPSLRRQVVMAMLREVLVRQSKRFYSKIFRVAEFSIQDTHLHLIVEATGVVETGGEDAADALRLGVTGFMISFAKRLNGLLRRKGKVWGDRWHGRELPSPREVRHALVYVFRNIAKHGARLCGDGFVDPMSSAGRFTLWTRPVETYVYDTEPWPEPNPMTWLLGRGWYEKHGRIEPNEVKRQGR